MSSIVDNMSECLHMVAGITLWNSMELRPLDGARSRTTPSLQKELGELGLASDQDASLMSSSGGFYQQVQPGGRAYWRHLMDGWME